MGKAQRENWGDDVNYLLGRMTESEREIMREQLLTDGDAFDRLREAENDLFDAYARNRLGGEDRAAFERTLLRQPGAAAKLGLARSWAPGARRATRWWWTSAAIAASILAVVVAWRSPDEASPARPLAPSAAPSQAPSRAPLALAAQTFRLNPVLRGTAQVQELRLAAGTAEIEFIAGVPAGSRLDRYEVHLGLDGGGAAWSGSVQPVGMELRWRTAALTNGSYVIRVGSAAQPLAFYEVRIVRP